jgi:hypothetical protein
MRIASFEWGGGDARGARADGVGKVIGWGALDSIYMPVLRTFGGAGCSAQSRLIQANAGTLIPLRTVLRGTGGEARDAGGPRGWGLPMETGWVGVEAA